MCECFWLTRNFYSGLKWFAFRWFYELFLTNEKITKIYIRMWHIWGPVVPLVSLNLFVEIYILSTFISYQGHSPF